MNISYHSENDLSLSLPPWLRFHPSDEEEIVNICLTQNVEKKPISIHPIKDFDIYKYDPFPTKEEPDVSLPGFRFHPSDEELVGFYLRRKVEKKPISIDLIKQIDIYKYDPWDLPKICTPGDRAWYFYSNRGKKRSGSIRPNKVTGSGFWKAICMDKPIYSVKETRKRIGLKTSLVYYRGSGGKGIATDWIMDEFRLPPIVKTANLPIAKNIQDVVSVPLFPP